MANTIELINMSNDTHTNFKGKLPEYIVSKGWEVCDSEELDKDKIIGVQVYKNESTKEVVLAIQGTNQKEDWITNISFKSGKYTDNIKSLVTYANENIKKEFEDKGYSIQVTGFSQGGGLAELLSYTYGWGGNGQNSPGAGNITEEPDYKEHLKSLDIEAKGVPSSYTTIVEIGDIVDNFGTHLGEVTKWDIVKSAISNNIFMNTPSIKLAEFLYDKIEQQHNIEKLNNYVLNLDDEAKKVFNYIMEIGTKETDTKIQTLETPKNYELSFKNSGWSFAHQDNLSQNKEAIDLLRDIVTYYGSWQAWSFKLESSLKEANPNSISNETKEYINLALNSTYGKNKIYENLVDTNNTQVNEEVIETKQEQEFSNVYRQMR